MSGHRRVKDIDYDGDDVYSEDDFDETGAGDEYSAEDKENFAILTPVVRAELEEAGAQADDTQIQEALWHYFWDIGKSVAYLKNSRTPRSAEKKEKPKSRFDEAAQVAQSNTRVCLSPTDPPDPTHMSFTGIPWTGLSVSMMGNLVPAHPDALQPHLLGGSSKLAKLAEERRQKAAAAQTTPAKAKCTPSLLEKLGKKPEDAAQKENCAPKPNSYPLRRRRSPTPPPKEPEPELEEEIKTADETPDLRGSPSSFGKTLSKGSQPPVEQDSIAFQDILHSCTDTAVFNGPSPDDVVQKAQKGAPQQNQQANGIQFATTQLEQTSLSGTATPSQAPKLRSKRLDVLKSWRAGAANRKQAASFVVIGHVDHGKSTLMGRMLLDTGAVAQRDIDKYKKQAAEIGKASFALAWVMDTGSEERERGVTVDIAQHHFSTETRDFTILDAPGHRDFVPNMIAGSSMADFALLVVDANQLESGMKGQTREHILLARSLGISRMLVAVNKMDTTHPAWKRAAYQDIVREMQNFLGKVGFGDNQVSFVPVSGLLGGNVVSALPKDSPGASWVNGSHPTLLQSLEQTPSASQDDVVGKPFRLHIADVFRGSLQYPLSIAGRLAQGSVQPGDVVSVAPSGETATVKAVEVSGEPKEYAVAGQIATLHLQDIDPVHVRVGDVLCSVHDPVKSVTSFTASVGAYEHVLPGPVDVHSGRLHAPAKLAFVVEAGKKKTRVLQPGAHARVRLQLEASLPLEAGDRIVVRTGGNTVAAGAVVAAAA